MCPTFLPSDFLPLSIVMDQLSGQKWARLQTYKSGLKFFFLLPPTWHSCSCKVKVLATSFSTAVCCRSLSSSSSLPHLPLISCPNSLVTALMKMCAFIQCLAIASARTHHAVDSEFVSGKLRHHLPVLHIPHPHAGQVSTLARDQVAAIVGEAETGDGLARAVGDVGLTVFAWIVKHNGASGRIEENNENKVLFTLLMLRYYSRLILYKANIYSIRDKTFLKRD